MFLSSDALATAPQQIKLTDESPIQLNIGQHLLDQANQNFQIAVVVLGALWSVAVVGKNGLMKGDVAEIAMFILATGLFVGFFLLNQHYLQLLDRVLRDAYELPILRDTSKTLGRKQIPDFLESPYVVAHEKATQALFYGALIVSSVAILSICKIRGSAEVAE